MNAEIIAIGTELLLGNILNTNAQFLSRQLAELGISVYYQTVVGDNENRLKETITNALNRANIIITTGGLGPTTDDMSKETIAEALGLKLVVHKESEDKLREFFKTRNICMTNNNLKQALMPEGATVIPNNNGTAPGFIVNKDDKIVIVLPGPPNEMVPMFKDTVKNELQKLNSGVIHSKTLKCCGIGESTIADKLKDIIDKQNNPTIAPYVTDGEVHLRVTAKAESIEEANILISKMEHEVRAIAGDYIYTDDDKTLEETIVSLLLKNNLTLSTAESCTGGLLSGRIINCSGVSDVFKEGFVTYSNEAKKSALNVKQETLAQYGAVSEETAREMVEGLVKKAKSDIGISVTGIAGPTGGTEDKPVGLVYIGFYYKDNITVSKYIFAGNRQKIRNRTVYESLNTLWKMIKN